MNYSHRKSPVAGQPQRSRLRWAVIAAVTLTTLTTLAACSSSGSSSTGNGKLASSKSITVTMCDDSQPDTDYLPLEMALHTMSSTYNVQKTIIFSDDTTALQALQQNKIQFMSESVPPSATALVKLPNVVAVGTRANDQWDMVVQNGINSCSDLNGKTVGLYSKAGVSTAYVKLYFAKECPNVSYNTIIIPDSTLRRQALEAGQLAATPLQATDAVQILNGPDKSKFHELVNFATALPGIGRDLVLTNKQTLENNPGVVQAFLTAQLQAIRQMYASPSKIPQWLATYLPGAVPANLAGLVAQYFTSRKLFCANGGLGDSSIADSLKTFGAAGDLPTSVTVAQLVDDAPMKKVLSKIGTSPATSC
jgi:ABC-type nitrate/sulfonate/bicarbonate transport system substrate-binding protein